MTARMTLDTARTQEPATSRLKGVKASVFLSALLSGLSLLSLSSAAEAAPFQQYKNGVCTSAKVCTIDFDL
ncbi:MAG TPA: hypothetical protein VFF88_09240, partial [Methylocella sp.]|nr:hypothetical protein [Methylocella sp.]